MYKALLAICLVATVALSVEAVSYLPSLGAGYGYGYPLGGVGKFGLGFNTGLLGLGSFNFLNYRPLYTYSALPYYGAGYGFGNYY